MSSGGGVAATMQRGIEGGAVLPAAPDDAEPGAGRDPMASAVARQLHKAAIPSAPDPEALRVRGQGCAWRCVASDPFGPLDRALVRDSAAPVTKLGVLSGRAAAPAKPLTGPPGICGFVRRLVAGELGGGLPSPGGIRVIWYPSRARACWWWRTRCSWLRWSRWS